MVLPAMVLPVASCLRRPTRPAIEQMSRESRLAILGRPVWHRQWGMHACVRSVCGILLVGQEWPIYYGSISAILFFFRLLRCLVCQYGAEIAERLKHVEPEGRAQTQQRGARQNAPEVQPARSPIIVKRRSEERRVGKEC